MEETKRLERQTLLFLVAEFSNHFKDLVAATLATMCKKVGVLFDVYYPAPQKGGFYTLDDTPVVTEGGGGLFSVYGSTLLGGRHYQTIARNLAQFDTHVIQLDESSVFASLFKSCASEIIKWDGDITRLYQWCVDFLDIPFPQAAVAFQMKGIPPGLRYGYIQYAFPEVSHRDAIAVPLELSLTEVGTLSGLGVRQVWTLSTKQADLTGWQQAGLEVKPAETLDENENYDSFTFRIAQRWDAKTSAVDLCEPVLASYWLPYAIQESRAQVCGTYLNETCERLAPIAVEKGQRMVFGRYAGGPIGGARNDEELFPLFRNNIPFQVIEPARPVGRVVAQNKKYLPQPQKSPFDLEPPDEELDRWMQQGKILTTLVFHSGELSHDDAMYNVMELSALTQVKVGLGVQSPRYTFEPDCVEPMHIPIEEGGMLGLCEPVLHSGGYGIIAEGLGNPQKIACLMKDARDEIAAITGERFAPRGVYCYLDAIPGAWHEKQYALWEAIDDAGFEYVISSVGQGNNQVLHQRDDFTVLNMWYCNHYPYSPFVRITTPEHLADMERQISGSGQPGWIIGVVDTPIFAYANYLVLGESIPSLRKPGIYPDVRIGRIFSYIQNCGETDKLVTATPRTIARYARLLQANNLVP
jgi:hypothetical protein